MKVQLSSLQTMGVLVEKRCDERGVDGHHDDGDHAQEHPNVEVEVGPCDGGCVGGGNK